MNDRVLALEEELTQLIISHENNVCDVLAALGIAAGRVLYGIGAIHGSEAASSAAQLLDTSVSDALDFFRQTARGKLH